MTFSSFSNATPYQGPGSSGTANLKRSVLASTCWDGRLQPSTSYWISRLSSSRSRSCSDYPCHYERGCRSLLCLQSVSCMSLPFYYLTSGEHVLKLCVVLQSLVSFAFRRCSDSAQLATLRVSYLHPASNGSMTYSFQTYRSYPNPYFLPCT